MSRFSTTLAEVLDRLDASQGDLAKMTGIEQSMISFYLSDRRNCSANSLDRFCQKLPHNAACMLARAWLEDNCPPNLLPSLQITFDGVLATAENSEPYNASTKKLDDALAYLRHRAADDPDLTGILIYLDRILR